MSAILVDRTSGGKPPASDPAEPTRPRLSPSGPSLERVNVVLSRLSLNTLDAASAKIRQDTGCRVNRSEIIRAMVEAFGESHLQFVSCRTETELRAVFLNYFREIGRTITRMEAPRKR
jgi:hypothetical protein